MTVLGGGTVPCVEALHKTVITFLPWGRKTPPKNHFCYVSVDRLLFPLSGCHALSFLEDANLEPQ